MIQKLKKAFLLLREQGPKGFAGTLHNYRQEKQEAAKALRLSQSFHLISDAERAAQKKAVFEEPLTFSILTPLFNTPQNYLEELLHSLEWQTYPDWELCLYDASDEAHAYVGDYCRQKAKEDPRFVYRKADYNQGISGNTNACLQLAGGTYIGLLDHDDILHESALYEMRRAIDGQKADFLYSDEVKFSETIETANDFNFKPAFGKDELRSHNYICHFTVFKRSLLGEPEEAYRPAFDGSQDHDMVLRLTERAERIVHLPKVLYYWRVHPDSVSMNLDSKSYAVDAAIHAIAEQLERAGEKGTVASNLPYRTIYRVRYELPENVKITVLVHHLTSAGQFAAVREQLLWVTAYQNVEILPLLKPDGSSFESLGVQVNAQMRQTDGDYIVLLHAACVPQTPEWLEEMLMFSMRGDVAMVSPKICFADDTICYAGLALDAGQPSGLRFPCQGTPDAEQGFEAMLRHVRNTTSAWEVCCMFSAEAYRALGGFAEDCGGYEAVDFSLKGVEKGRWNVWTCFAKMMLHDREAARMPARIPEAFRTRWQTTLLQEDPYLNPSLKKLGIL